MLTSAGWCAHTRRTHVGHTWPTRGVRWAASVVATASFAALLRQHRLALGLTQEELAERAGLSARGVQDLERGLKQAPRPSTVRLLVRGLGLPEAEAAALLRAAQPPRPAGADTEPDQNQRTLPLPLTSFVGRERELADLTRLLGSARLEADEFGALLRRHRIKLRLTQEGLAERAGLSARAVSDIERGLHRTPQRETALRLVDALGLTNEQRRQLLSARDSGAPHADTPTRGRRATLPLFLTSLVGRERHTAEVIELLRSRRLVTLTGPGGVGKTRLALSVATAVAAQHNGAVVLVELEALTHPELVLHAVASAIGIVEQQARSLRDTLIDELRPHDLLLVLDNCEHLVQSCADVVHMIVRACAGVHVLATSREPLGVRGESVWQVPPLVTFDNDAPLDRQVESDAVRLFLDRARAVKSDFALTSDNVTVVASICRRLDGIPLALELAAARLNVLSPREILLRLDNALPLLSNAGRAAPERQRTMRSALDWSYQLLGGAEQRVLERLSVFAGGFGLQAAEAVCADEQIEAGAMLAWLGSLVDRSLVVVEARDGASRYHMLEVVRQYAAERLMAVGESERTITRHAGYFVDLARRTVPPPWEVYAANPVAHAPEHVRWADALEAEHDNLRASLQHLLQRGDAVGAQRLGAAVWQFWSVRGYLSEGRMWLQQVLALPGGTHEGRIRVLQGSAFLAFRQADTAAARTLQSQVLQLTRESRDATGAILCRLRLADLDILDGLYDSATQRLNEALGEARQLRNRSVEAWGLASLGQLALAQGDNAGARSSASEALVLFQEVGSQRGEAVARRWLGDALLRLGEFDAAGEILEVALASYQARGDQWNTALLFELLGRVAIERGELDRARSLLVQGLELHRLLGDRVRVIRFLDAFARLASREGHAERAQRLTSAASAAREQLLRRTTDGDGLLNESIAYALAEEQ